MRAPAAILLAFVASTSASACLSVPDPGAGRDGGGGGGRDGGVVDGGAVVSDDATAADCPDSLTNFIEGFANLDAWAPSVTGGCEYGTVPPGAVITNSSTVENVGCALQTVQLFAGSDGLASVTLEPTFTGLPEIAVRGADSSFFLRHDGATVRFDRCEQGVGCSEVGSFDSDVVDLRLVFDGEQIVAEAGALTVGITPMTETCVRFEIGVRQAPSALTAASATFTDVNVVE